MQNYTQLKQAVRELKIHWTRAGLINDQPVWIFQSYGHNARISFGFDKKWSVIIDKRGKIFDEDREADAMAYAEQAIRSSLLSRIDASERLQRDIASLPRSKPKYIKEVRSEAGTGKAHITFFSDAVSEDLDCAQFFMTMQDHGLSIEEANSHAKIGHELAPAVDWKEIKRVIDTFTLNPENPS